MRSCHIPLGLGGLGSLGGVRSHSGFVGRDRLLGRSEGVGARLDLRFTQLCGYKKFQFAIRSIRTEKGRMIPIDIQTAVLVEKHHIIVQTVLFIKETAAVSSIIAVHPHVGRIAAIVAALVDRLFALCVLGARIDEQRLIGDDRIADKRALQRDLQRTRGHIELAVAIIERDTDVKKCVLVIQFPFIKGQEADTGHDPLGEIAGDFNGQVVRPLVGYRRQTATGQPPPE